MRIHHLDCGRCHPLGGSLMDGFSAGPVGRVVCHCLLIETERHGLILVDTGFGLGDVHQPHPRLPRLNTALLRPDLDPRRTALHQLRAMGFAADDVRHIVLTHLDFDHAGGLTDFPRAVVHVTAVEARAARARHGFIERCRWRPAQWGATGRWQLHPMPGAAPVPGDHQWFDFPALPLPLAPDVELLLVPLPGHTPGQVGVALRHPAGHWLLHAADSYFSRGEVHDRAPHCPPGLRAYEALMQADGIARRDTQQRLRRFVQGPDAAGVAVFCTHDPVEFLAMQALAERHRAGHDRRAA